jgi:hypothetical protein
VIRRSSPRDQLASDSLSRSPASLAGARRCAVLKAKPYGRLDGDDIAIVHLDELLARPAALQLVAGFARGAHEQASAILMQRGTAAPPLAVVGHDTRE